MRTAESHAKVNLFLHVTGKRPDGYHELYTLFAPVSLSDTVTLTGSDSFRITCNDPSIPVDERNIVWKVYDILRRDYGCTAAWHVHIEKRIPSGAGLGGGSSNAAAFLKLADADAELGLEYAQMADVLAQVGSDTVFFLHSRPMLGVGRGEILLDAPKVPPVGVLLVNPGIFVSTPSVYKDENLRLTSPDKVPTMRGDLTLAELRALMKNDLERPVFIRHPEIAALAAEIESLGSLKSLMSGSGSTVFGIFDSEAALDRAYSAMRASHPDMLVIQTHLVQEGAK